MAQFAMLSLLRAVLQTEVNAVTDNPVFVVEIDELVALPGGNGHGAPTALRSTSWRSRSRS